MFQAILIWVSSIKNWGA